MEIIFVIAVISGLIWLYKYNLSNSDFNKFTPEEKKFMKINQDITDTVVVNFNKIKKIADKKISLQYITSGNWRLQKDDTNLIYTFRSNSELLIIVDGIVKKGSYEYIIDNNSIIISSDNISKMFNVLNVKNDTLILQNISDNEIFTFFNETKIKDVIIAESNRKQQEIDRLNYKRNNDEEFRYIEMIEESQKFSYEKTLEYRLRDLDYFEYINILKNENKISSEIVKDQKEWANNDSNLHR